MALLLLVNLLRRNSPRRQAAVTHTEDIASSVSDANCKARVTPNTDVLRTAPDGPEPPGIKSLSIRGGPGPSWVFMLRQSKFVDDSSSSRQRYELLRHRHGIITDGAGATTK